MYDPTHPEGGVPGNDNRYYLDGTAGSLPKDQEDLGGSEEHAASKQCVSERYNSPDREDDLGHPSHSASSTVLQESPERCFPNTRKEQPGLRRPLSPVAREHRGASVVDRPPHRMEWKKSHEMAESRHDNRIRCIPQRMGSNLEWGEHGRPVEHTGKTLAHHLPGDPGSQLSCPNIREESVQQSSAIATGQHDSSILYKSPRGHSIPPSNTIGQGFMVMVPETEHLTEGTTSPREGERRSRPRIQSNEGQVRLDVEPNSIQQDKEDTSDGNRPICITADLSTPQIFQLETRPTSYGNRCLPTGLVEHDGICQPSLEPNRQSPCKDPKSSEHSNDPDNTTLACTAMVHSSIGPFNRHATPPPRKGGPNVGNAGGNITRGNPQTSRVDYLKQSYSTKNISESASRLLLSSWRDKSSKSYDSLFKKWVGWCEERNADPIASPVNEVVNFLADLHDKGYSYRSLNAYQSAISSTHDRVDGISIGQHPLVCLILTHLNHVTPPLGM